MATYSARRIGAATAASAPGTEAQGTSESLVVYERKSSPPVMRQVARTLQRYNGPIDEALRSNAFPDKVVAITKRAPTEHARIEVGAETMVTTSTTNEAVEALALEGGKPASAVIKASDTMIVIGV